MNEGDFSTSSGRNVPRDACETLRRTIPSRRGAASSHVGRTGSIESPYYKDEIIFEYATLTCLHSSSSISSAARKSLSFFNHRRNFCVPSKSAGRLVALPSELMMSAMSGCGEDESKWWLGTVDIIIIRHHIRRVSATDRWTWPELHRQLSAANEGHPWRWWKPGRSRLRLHFPPGYPRRHAGQSQVPLHHYHWIPDMTSIFPYSIYRHNTVYIMITYFNMTTRTILPVPSF